ncbi:MAG TPA: gamma-glutamylcyclotransferase family protein [Gammaproteobacteria bacterium]|nr:gamma-glutamylcyclotransferase family protein [Gammaproteobacteria bacterium]
MYTEKLFSYGTLRQESVQLEKFRRKLDGMADTLKGFSLSMVEIKDPQVVAISGQASHPILNYTGNATDHIEGMVFDVTAEELKQADAYETKDYRRVSVQLTSGLTAWVYVNANSPVNFDSV